MVSLLKEAVISFPEQQAKGVHFIAGYSLEGLQVRIKTTCCKHSIGTKKEIYKNLRGGNKIVVLGRGFILFTVYSACMCGTWMYEVITKGCGGSSGKRTTS